VSAWEGPPEPGELDDDELEEYLLDVFRELRLNFLERAGHDRDGYFCHVAGSTECMALGHKPNADGEWTDEDDDHHSAWDGDLICPATRYADACSQCEGECSMPDVPDLWALVRASS
jgi:hypothetical protein